MADADLEEHRRLEAVIADVEKLLASPQGASPLLTAFRDNARKQLESIEKKIKAKEQEARLQQDILIQAAVDRETKLNAEEKRSYGDLLGKDFFTKSDFGHLERFYTKTWDKLSEDGKDKLSQRVWEGVRRKEYQFSDLPDVVQDKETDRAYAVLKKRATEQPSKIPISDREDFIRAYQDGDHHKAKEILGRKTFSENMFLSPASTERKSSSADVGRDIIGDGVEAKARNRQSSKGGRDPAKFDGSADVDLAGLAFGGAHIAEPPKEISAADIPSAALVAANKTKSSRGC